MTGGKRDIAVIANLPCDYPLLRTLALHRIQSVTILDEATCVPADFSIDEQINIGKFGFGHGELIQLEAIFYSAMGNHMFETALSHDQTITKQENGSFRLTATVADTPQLVWWLLGLSDSVEVIKPE
ncbi:MAG: WYL domain-containing protein [Proteobacteria bacterium]|nr:WYL domain-containing protein [Pseudomonadota bacterium]